MIRNPLQRLTVGLGALIVAACLAITLLPPFLDRIYYQGPRSDHYDGQRFRNPDNDEDTAGVPSGGSRAGFLWRFLTGNDGRPAWPAQVSVQQSKPPARIFGQRMLVTWIGHATVLVQTNGLNILTDPIYAARSGPFGFGPKRVAVPGVQFEDLPKIDVVLVSHDHYDHMDLGTLKQLWDRDRPTIITSLGNETLVRSIGAKAMAVDWNREIRLRTGCAPSEPRPQRAPPTCQASPISVVITRNHHWGSRWFTDRNRALWSSFVIKLPGGNVFFAGDTGFGDGKWPAEAAKFGLIRLALIPIGAFRFQAGQMQAGSHIGPGQAVEVFRRLGARYAIPIHWGTFRLSWEAYDTPPKLLDRIMMCRGLNDFTSYPIGAQVDVPPIDAPRVKLPPVPRPASCDARPLAPDLR